MLKAQSGKITDNCREFDDPIIRPVLPPPPPPKKKKKKISSTTRVAIPPASYADANNVNTCNEKLRPERLRIKKLFLEPVSFTV